MLSGLAIFAGVFGWAAFAQVSAHGGSSGLIRQTPSGVEIETEACLLAIRPITASAMRVRCTKGAPDESPSIVLLKQSSVPAFKVSQDATSVVVATSKMKAVFDRQSGALRFTDGSDKTFLSEIPGTRRLTPATLQGEPAFAVEQDFISPPGEHLFGSGEFQDGFLDIRDLPRRLTQVNSQIAIPFLGLPGLTVSTGLVGRVPVGVQVVSGRYREDLCLLAGEAIEAGGTPPSPVDPVS